MQKTPDQSELSQPREPDSKATDGHPVKPHDLKDDVKRVQKSWAKRWGQDG